MIEYYYWPFEFRAQFIGCILNIFSEMKRRKKLQEEIMGRRRTNVTKKKEDMAREGESKMMLKMRKEC